MFAKKANIALLFVFIFSIEIFVFSLIDQQPLIENNTDLDNLSPKITALPTISGHYQFLSPSGGEVWQVGQTYTVRWATVLPVDEDVRILRIYKNDTLAFDAFAIQANYAISFTIPNALGPGDDYRFFVMCRSNNDQNGISNYFTIIDKYDDDQFEPNDERQYATPIDSGFYPNCIANDEDHYAVTGEIGWRIQIWINFTHAEGNLNLYFRKFGDSICYSISSTDNEYIEHICIENRTYTFDVQGGIADSDQIYNLTVVIDPEYIPEDDEYEENDIKEDAPEINGINIYNNLEAYDDDWYKVYAEPGWIIKVHITYFYYQGVLNLYLFNETDELDIGTTYVSGFSTYSGYYFIKVGDMTNPWGYSLEISFSSILDDPYEENDYYFDAKPLNEGHYPNLIANDADWYSIGENHDQYLRIWVEFNSSYGDLDLTLRATNEIALEIQTNGDEEFLEYKLEYWESYDIGIAGTNPSYNLTYFLYDDITPDDEHEPNNNKDLAVALVNSTYYNLVLLDDDWFKIPVDLDNSVEISIQFNSTTNDLSINIYDESTLLYHKISDNGNLLFKVNSLIDGFYYLQIYGDIPNQYNLSVTIYPDPLELDSSTSDSSVLDSSTSDSSTSDSSSPDSSNSTDNNTDSNNLSTSGFNILSIIVSLAIIMVNYRKKKRSGQK